MPKRTLSVKRIKPPVGFQEAARLLRNVAGMTDETRARRLKQAGYNIQCAIPWAEKACAASSAADAVWLDKAVGELRRFEMQLGELVGDVETGRRGWQPKLDDLMQTLEDISLLYARGAFGDAGPAHQRHVELGQETTAGC